MNTPRPEARRPRRALVLGCGGTLGAAWSIATLLEVRRALAWEPRSADLIIGTSAGAELAAWLGSGVGVDEILMAALNAPEHGGPLAKRFATSPPAFPPLPSARLGSPALAATLLAPRRSQRPLLTRLAGLLPIGRGDSSFVGALVDALVPAGAWAPHPACWVVAVDFDTGRRVAFGAAGAPRASLSDAVRASWAIPGWYPPVAIEGRRYIDGGVASPASADLALDLDGGVDEAIVLAPMASTHQGARRGLGRLEGALRAGMTRALDAETERLRARGVRVLRLEPGPEDLAAMGPNLMAPSRRFRVLETSLRSARRAVRVAVAESGFSVPSEARLEGAQEWNARTGLAE